jgi:hypothetical protein
MPLFSMQVTWQCAGVGFTDTCRNPALHVKTRNVNVVVFGAQLAREDSV